MKVPKKKAKTRVASKKVVKKKAAPKKGAPKKSAKKTPKKAVKKKASPKAKPKIKLHLKYKSEAIGLRKLPDDKLNLEKLKFETVEPNAELKQSRKDITLPKSYGDNKIISMVRDPWWIYSYWEITPQRDQEIRSQMDEDGAVPKCTILRIYDITGVDNFTGTNANSSFDVEMKTMALSWYVDVGQPNRQWCVDIGILAEDGRFYLLARSNYVHTPRFGMSNIFDEEWMCQEEDYWEIFGMSGGFGVGKSSMEVKALFKKYFKEWISSGSVSSLSSFVLAKKEQ